MGDVAALDPELAAEIAIAGKFFGYSFRSAMGSQSGFKMIAYQSEESFEETSLAGSKREPYECQ